MIRGLGNAFWRAGRIQLDQTGLTKCGDSTIITIENDTIQKLLAIGNAQSVTWQVSEEQGDGLAKFTADSSLQSLLAASRIRWFGSERCMVNGIQRTLRW